MARRFAFALLFGALTISVLAQESPLASLMWIQAPKIKLQQWSEITTRGHLQEAIDAVFAEGFKKQKMSYESQSSGGPAILSGELDWSKAKGKELEWFKSWETRTQARYLLVLQLDKYEQKNASSSDMLSNMAKPPGLTKVEARAFIYDKQSRSLMFIGKDRPVSGEHRGAFFGTRANDEMSGSPQDKEVMVRLENKRRCDAIARAMWNAFSPNLIALLKPTLH
jgi:hypothetical protein